MKNSSYDIIIVGDGSIGLLSAYKLLSADKNLKVLIISENLKSASKAAGAMHAAFGEIEKNFYDSDHENKILELSLNSPKISLILASIALKPVVVPINAK